MLGGTRVLFGALVVVPPTREARIPDGTGRTPEVVPHPGLRNRMYVDQHEKRDLISAAYFAENPNPGSIIPPPIDWLHRSLPNWLKPEPKSAKASWHDRACGSGSCVWALRPKTAAPLANPRAPNWPKMEFGMPGGHPI
jgi:hypothetical protein